MSSFNPHTDSSRTKVKIAQTQQEKERIYAFRHKIYVEEMNLRVKSGASNLLSDELDETAINLYLENDGEVVGVIRVNFGREFKIPPFLYSNYKIDLFAKYPVERFCFFSRLMLAKDFRGGAALGPLIQTIYKIAWDRGAYFGFCDCQTGLVGMYEHIGFRRYTTNFVYPDIGYRIPIVILIQDTHYLRKIRSPLCPVIRDEMVPSRTPDETFWFAQTFPTQFEVPEWVLSPQEFFNFVHQRLDSSQGSFFSEFTEEETKLMLTRGAIIQCQKGDLLYREGDQDQNFYVVLSGLFELQLSNDTVPMLLFSKGQCIGELSILMGLSKSSRIVAVEKSEVLTISHSTLDSIQLNSPQLAAKFLTAVSRSLADRILFSTRKRFQQGSNLTAQEKHFESALDSYHFDYYQDRSLELERLKRQAELAWQFEEKSIRKFGLRPGMRVLDVGCGTGDTSLRLAEIVGPQGSVLGIDSNDSLLAQAAEKLSHKDRKVRFQKLNLYELESLEEQFDFVYARLVFQHLFDPLKALALIQRILKPKGKVCLFDIDDSVIHFWPHSEDFNKLNELAFKGQAERGGDRNIGQKLSWYLHKSGFQPIQFEIIPVSTEEVGMENFLKITTSFKVEAVSDADREKAKGLLSKIQISALEPEAYGWIGIFMVSGEKIGAVHGSRDKAVVKDIPAVQGKKRQASAEAQPDSRRSGV